MTSRELISFPGFLFSPQNRDPGNDDAREHYLFLCMLRSREYWLQQAMSICGIYAYESDFI